VRAQAESVAIVPFCVVDNIRFLYGTAIPARGFFGSRARAPEGSPHLCKTALRPMSRIDNVDTS
jgi:hypothetical protein